MRESRLEDVKRGLRAQVYFFERVPSFENSGLCRSSLATPVQDGLKWLCPERILSSLWEISCLQASSGACLRERWGGGRRREGRTCLLSSEKSQELCEVGSRCFLGSPGAGGLLG